MHRVFLWFLALAIILSPMGALAKAGPEQLEEALQEGSVIRLHILAAGDDDENQRIKLCVRDEILKAWGETLSAAEASGDMLKLLKENLPGLLETARDTAQKEGFTGEVTAEIGIFPFPDREYDGMLVPAGDYQALRIVLGGGAGHNWWCVLYPAMCLDLAATEPAAGEPQPAEAAPEDASVQFTWGFLRIFSRWPMVPVV